CYAWLTNARPPTHTAERLLLLVGMAGYIERHMALGRGGPSSCQPPRAPGTRPAGPNAAG
ncbi:MAG: hypothetical protein J2P28_25620, partial [Actinobacteria bacterium]|nr:hypothetical protein [Actinomycetota bacterium]